MQVRPDEKGCPSLDKAFWQSIVDADYAVPAEHTPTDLTPKLLALLSSTDPYLRDAIAYPILEAWISRDLYTADDLRAMAGQLSGNLKVGLGEQNTESVFLRAFSALVLAEMVYHHNEHPFFEETDVRQILENALAYYPAEQDLRGYVSGLGWAHAIAHGADLLYVLAENSFLSASDLERIMQALATQIAPPIAHAYLYNEDQRITRAVLAALKRDLLTLPFLSAWLDRLTAFEGQKITFDGILTGEPRLIPSERGINVLHNTRQFLSALYVHLALDEQKPAIATDLAPLVLGALQPMNAW
ncbi:MAG TPA: DUF2785 domain-containing protein [Ktedonobacterales bacterium]